MPGSFKLNLDAERAEIIMPEDGPEDLIEEVMVFMYLRGRITELHLTKVKVLCHMFM